VPSAAPWIDLLDARFYVDEPRRAYAWMRRHAPVYFDERNSLWGLTTYDTVRAAEGNSTLFSSAGGSRPDTGPLPWLMDLDPPAHSKRRKLVHHAFTPARVRASSPRIRALCDDLIDRVCELGECDFCRDLAAPLPLVVICDLLGIPADDHAAVLRWSDDLLGSLNGSADSMQAAAAAFGEFLAYAHALLAARRAQPTDDLVSVLVHAEVDGDRLTDDELAFDVLLLLLGGDETTRNVTCGGMEQLLAHPAQKRRVANDPALLPRAVEEMLRWVSPIKNMSRTLTRDTDFGSQMLRQGDTVLLLYESANFDETHFDDAERFVADRSPNEHLAFGFGPHFCLGAGLARLELQTMFGRLLERLPDLELVGDEPPPRSITGISAMPVQFSPTTRLHPGGAR
jgi:cytochrome P450 family 142 subfamily A polypeptide 1